MSTVSISYGVGHAARAHSIGARASVSGARVSAARVSDARPRLHLTKRGRVVLTALVALPLVIAATAFALNGGVAAATGQSSSQSLQYTTVVPGESLWQLAQSIAPTADPREVVSDIVRLNQLTSADVEAGQRLAIPSQYAR
jgi:LysM repeat protein